VVLLPAAGGPEQTVPSHAWWWMGRLAWLPDGSGLVMGASERPGESPLWHLAYPGGAARRITPDLDSYSVGGLTADGRTLVTVRGDLVSRLWIAPNGEAKRARPFTSGASKYEGLGGVAWTPDGKVVYDSETGTDSLWILDSDGHRPRQLTPSSNYDFQPVVAPDGRTIVFVSDRSGKLNLWRIDADGGDLKQLTRGDSDRHPQISPDGKWVVYVSPSARAGRTTLWKIRLEGGEPVELTQRGISGRPGISPDGRRIAFPSYDAETNKSSIDIMPFDGGEPTERVELPPDAGSSQGAPQGLWWAPDGHSIYCVRTSKGVSNLWSLPLGGGQPKQLTAFDADLIFAYAWSRDGKQLAVARGRISSDVVLITDSR
jgi:Tol biopolymer transport system component